MKTEDTITGNFHTHTFRCKHAVGDIPDYAAKAVEKNLKVLGISDHTPFPDRKKWCYERMDIDLLDSYDRAFMRAREAHPDLKIVKGMECDWDPEYTNFYTDELRGARNCVYLIGSVHYLRHEDKWICCYSGGEVCGMVRQYGEAVVKMIESRVFDFVGHPDLFGLFTLKWDAETIKASEEICKAAKKNNIPLEINGGGFRRAPVEASEGTRYPYPIDAFWEIAADYEVEVICNSDAHLPDDVIASVDLCREIVKKNNLKLALLHFMQ